MKIRKILSWAAVVAWMVLIFFMSAQVAEESNNLSIGITDKIIKEIEKLIPRVQIDRLRFNHIIRKSAHYFTYMVLGLLTCNALIVGGNMGSRTYLTAMTICFLYAVSDEVHQLFVSGRGGQVKDVLIDSLGSLTGLSVHVTLIRLVRMIKNR